jgi:hypothetical protein
MRPVRFVALSEDGHAFVLADEVGRLLALPIDDRLQTAIRPERHSLVSATSAAASGADADAALSPRDIQARIRAGESADDVARIAGVPVDRVLRYAGPVLQERAMLAQHARRTKLRTSDNPPNHTGASLAEVVDGRLAQHGVDAEKISWDAYRRDDGTWRVVATWPSGKATAQAIWELDRTRQLVIPHDDMAQYLCAERPAPVRGQEPQLDRPGRGLAPPQRTEHGHAAPGRGMPGRGVPGSGGLVRPAAPERGAPEEIEPGRVAPGRIEPGRGGHEPMRPAAGTGAGAGTTHPAGTRRPGRTSAADWVATTTTERAPAARTGRAAETEKDPDPIRAGRDALLASLDRPLETPGGVARRKGRTGGPFDDDLDAPKEVPAVPSLAVLRPRRPTADQAGATADRPRKRAPSWDDVLFGSAPARESS